MEEIMKSKVYVQIDENNLIIRCEGGYTTPEDLTGWTYIDEGTGDKYNLCQSHYFDGGLYDVDGIPRYKLVDGAPTLRTDAEMEADRAALPVPEYIPMWTGRNSWKIALQRWLPRYTAYDRRFTTPYYKNYFRRCSNDDYVFCSTCYSRQNHF